MRDSINCTYQVGWRLGFHLLTIGCFRNYFSWDVSFDNWVQVGKACFFGCTFSHEIKEDQQGVITLEQLEEGQEKDSTISSFKGPLTQQKNHHTWFHYRRDHGHGKMRKQRDEENDESGP